MSKRKRYNISIPVEYVEQIEHEASAHSLPPTTYLTRIIEQALDIKTRPVGNPDIGTYNKSDE